MLDSFIYDAVLYVITVLIGVGIAIHRLNHDRSLLWFALLYIAGTYSSYNIMIKPIMDFNLVVPRNFLYHYKLLGPLSMLDLLMILCCFIFVAKSIYNLKVPLVVPQPLRLVLYRDVIIIFVSALAFVLLKDISGSRLQNEIIWYRQLFYYIGLFSLIAAYVKYRDNSFDFERTFITFLLLDTVNFLSGFIATTFIYKGITWQRYFLNVSIIDQDDYPIAFVYLLLAMLFIVLNKKATKSKICNILIFSIALLVLFNFVKGIYLFALLFIPFLFFTSLRTNSKNTYRSLFALLLMVPAALFLLYVFTVVGSKYSSSLNTRSDALHDYLDTVNSYGSIYHLIGTGNGTYYTRNYSDEDKGEIKAIDKENYENKVFIMQTIFTQFYKAGGLVGIICYIVLSSVAIYTLISSQLNNHPYSIVVTYHLCVIILLNFMFFAPEASVSFTVVKEYLLLTLINSNRSAIL